MNELLQADRPDFMSLTVGGTDLFEQVVGEADLFEQAVPRTLVHRAAISEVLLTGVRRRGGGTFRVGAQWSRGHSYYGAVGGRWHDPMLFVESIRQVGLLLAHEALHVPLAYRFLTRSMGFDVAEAGVRLGRGPAHVVLDVTLHGVVRRRNVVSAFAYDVVGYRDGQRIGSGRVTASVVSPTVYHRVRGGRAEATAPRELPCGIEPGLVGRTHECDVVLSAGSVGGVRELRADLDHPVLFDHPLDHIPGMVLMEAARQSALVELGLPHGLLVGSEAVFHRYVEFDSPCRVSVVGTEPGASRARHSLSVRFDQAGGVAATCRVVVHDGSDGE